MDLTHCSAITIAAQLGGKSICRGPCATFLHHHSIAAGVPINLRCHFSCIPPLPWQHSWSSHGYGALCPVFHYHHSSSAAGSPICLHCPALKLSTTTITTTATVAQLEEGGIAAPTPPSAKNPLWLCQASTAGALRASESWRRLPPFSAAILCDGSADFKQLHSTMHRQTLELKKLIWFFFFRHFKASLRRGVVIVF